MEAKNSQLNLTTLIDYEIKSEGLLEGGEMVANDSILLSFLYGHTGQTGARTLGYYYHSVKSYSDFGNARTIEVAA